MPGGPFCMASPGITKKELCYMGLFSFSNSEAQVKGLQVLFKDNRHVKFRLLPLRHTCLCEMTSDNQKAVNCWKDYFNNRYVFNGYKKLTAGKVTLSFQRDIILNSNNIIPAKKLPEEGGDLKQHKDIAISRMREIKVQKDNSPTDKISTAMVISFIVFSLILAVAFVKEVI